MPIFDHGDLVFDIGAHYGESVDKFCHKYGAGLCISVEPCLENYLKLVAAIKEKESKAIPIHAAVWDRPCIAGARLANAQTGLSTLKIEKWGSIYSWADFGAPEDMASITIDMLAQRYGIPSYVKIDVEGAEMEAISGMSFKTRAVSFEFHRQYRDDAMLCLDKLANLGYLLASYVEADVDLDSAPSIPMVEFKEKFISNDPQWGNITVA